MYSRHVAASVTATGRGMLIRVIEAVHRYATFRLHDGSFVHCYSPRWPTEEQGGGPREWFRFGPLGETVEASAPDPADVQHAVGHRVIYGDTDSGMHE